MQRNIGKLAAKGVLAAVMISWGHASLELYPDAAIYRYVSADTYVGFVEGAAAWCGLEPAELERRYGCLESKRLCRERQEIDALEEEISGIRKAMESLRQWNDATRPNAPDAAPWISAAQKLGERRAQWAKDLQKRGMERSRKKKRFLRQVSAPRPLFLEEPCKSELEVRLPGGLVEARLRNEAILDAKKIHIRRYAVLRNHSGIDILSKDTRLYARPLHRPLRPVSFEPWSAASSPQERNATSASFPREKHFFIDRDYAIGKVTLPSDGRELRVLIEGYDVPRQCEEILYSWKEPTVYHSCRFRPPGPVGSDQWIIREGADDRGHPSRGEWENGKYLLPVGRDERIEVRRRLRPLDPSRGGSEGRMPRNWELSLELINKEEKPKTLKIVERLPGADAKSEVKIEKIEGAVEESLEESGRLVMQTVLAPREHKEIRVRFTVRPSKALR